MKSIRTYLRKKRYNIFKEILIRQLSVSSSDIEYLFLLTFKILSFSDIIPNFQYYFNSQKKPTSLSLRETISDLFAKDKQDSDSI